MALDFTTSYAAIIKQEKQDDGTLLVYGKATDDAIDSDNQICDAGWLNKAMPEWFKSGGNIREQHSNIAAGVAKELDSKDDGHYISALVVDAQSVKKVETGVLKGFSIGIRAPRIVRDNKAANGRIIDGQIVEVSLVDRPANPNAKLMLAKSDGTEVIQVEEMIEQETPASEEVVETPAVVEENVETIDEKSVTPEIKKFDQALFDAARIALAGLIAVEAGELAEGHDERYSLDTLNTAVHALMAWLEGEIAEGEVAPDTGVESIELAANPSCSCDGCKECKDAGGCEKSPCSKCMMAKSEKCLECGCHKVADDHGRSDVTTAEIVEEKSSTTILPRIGTEGQDLADNGLEDEDSDSVKSSDKTAMGDFDINGIIEKAVKSATESVRSEIEVLKSSHVEELNKVQTELAEANSKAAKGGPKRFGAREVTRNDSVLLAAEYRAKASATSDPILSKGYRDLAEEFLAKSSTSAE